MLLDRRSKQRINHWHVESDPVAVAHIYSCSRPTKVLEVNAHMQIAALALLGLRLTSLKSGMEALSCRIEAQIFGP